MVLSRLESLARIGVGFALLGAGGVVWMACALLVFPSHRARARVSNAFAKWLGGALLALTKCSVEVKHEDRLVGPAIFVSNHTSMIDILLAAFLVPPLTIALGKREILRYPIVGLLFLLSGSVAVDRARARPERSALHELARRLVDRRLGVFMWPEGTRSADHHLGPFHMGFARLSQLTGLDVVPVVVHGAWRAWPRKTLRLTPTHLHVEVMERVSASAFAPGSNLASAAEAVRESMRQCIDAEPSVQRAPVLRTGGIQPGAQPSFQGGDLPSTQVSQIEVS